MSPEATLARADDAGRIAELLREAARSVPPGQFVADDEAFVRRHIRDEGFTLVATCRTELAGCLIVRIPGEAEDNLGRNIGLPPAALGSIVHMESVAVAPDYRGQGLQRRLVAEAEKRAADRFRLAACTVSPDNTVSLRNFEHLGYEVVATTAKYGDLPRHILVKSLDCPCAGAQDAVI